MLIKALIAAASGVIGVGIAQLVAGSAKEKKERWVIIAAVVGGGCYYAGQQIFLY